MSTSVVPQLPYFAAPEPLKFTDEQKKLWRAAYATYATDDQAALFFEECSRRRLIPGKDVVFQVRRTDEYNPKLGTYAKVDKVILVTTIKALRLIAQRTFQFDGYGETVWYYGDAEGNPTVKSDIPLGKIPHAAKVTIYRKDWKQPVIGIARWDAYAQKNSKKELTHVWSQRGEEQLAKCAEADALRKFSPEEIGDMYLKEEFEHEDQPQAEQPKQAQQPVITNTPVKLVPPEPMVAPAINQAPAEIPPATTVVPPAPVNATPSELPFPRPIHDDLTKAVNAQPKVGEVAPTAVNAQPKVANAQPQVNPAVPVQVNKEPAPVPVKEDAPLPPPVTPPIPVPAAADDVPAVGEEKSALLQRASKIVRDVLPKAGIKAGDCGPLMKAYLAKVSGKADINKIPKQFFGQVLTLLEGKTPAEVAAILKG